ncbi:DUF4231 domain-containing protein [Mycoplasmopsis lipofaciens]|uniref:DUF4231 domain-containing protein n=1 Tax=Mycoplasmopsis lipofaciens TaxID=114884 RepID=UPI0006896E84|nr:DUF4231 domain-containing protein [Mycoplasmopsis lipofaciens]
MNKENNVNLQLIKEAETKFKEYRKKYLISKSIYIFIGLIILVISSLQILFNLFAIRWNDSYNLKLIFLTIAIISAIIVFIQSLLLFFNFKQSKESNLSKLRKLQSLKESYLNEPEAFKVSKIANEIYEIDNNK